MGRLCGCAHKISCIYAQSVPRVGDGLGGCYQGGWVIVGGCGRGGWYQGGEVGGGGKMVVGRWCLVDRGGVMGWVC